MVSKWENALRAAEDHTADCDACCVFVTDLLRSCELIEDEEDEEVTT